MVEALTLRAFSLGLLKGRVDQVDAVVHVTFVKPRVLDKVQIAGLKERVETWRQKAATAQVFMEEQTNELLS
jgi:26S proteasome regulatory subunit N9